ncbi:hypothetical protein [Paenibacillus donghaensis]|uniref:Uncharacterized protein n=1 Tax=Paenibacillus donghaensis TaxID=414771 RepID=A0A2Z2K937_9BACL|nr:hypothetical protein [Paenibacillus donghaensis]ASA21914.1 hypothetical protein B9T62_14690 [Paenibacillus donghaensis]
MKKKYIAVLMVLFVFLLLIPGYIEARNGMDSGTKDRLIEKYGLDKSTTSNWNVVDVGISNPVQLFIIISKVIVNPSVFAVQEVIYSLMD